MTENFSQLNNAFLASLVAIRPEESQGNFRIDPLVDSKSFIPSHQKFLDDVNAAIERERRFQKAPDNQPFVSVLKRAPEKAQPASPLTYPLETARKAVTKNGSGASVHIQEQGEKKTWPSEALALLMGGAAVVLEPHPAPTNFNALDPRNIQRSLTAYAFGGDVTNSYLLREVKQTATPHGRSHSVSRGVGAGPARIKFERTVNANGSVKRTLDVRGGNAVALGFIKPFSGTGEGAGIYFRFQLDPITRLKISRLKTSIKVSDFGRIAAQIGQASGVDMKTATYLHALAESHPIFQSLKRGGATTLKELQQLLKGNGINLGHIAKSFEQAYKTARTHGIERGLEILKKEVPQASEAHLRKALQAPKSAVKNFAGQFGLFFAFGIGIDYLDHKYGWGLSRQTKLFTQIVAAASTWHVLTEGKPSAKMVGSIRKGLVVIALWESWGKGYDAAAKALGYSGDPFTRFLFQFIMTVLSDQALDALWGYIAKWAGSDKFGPDEPDEPSENWGESFSHKVKSFIQLADYFGFEKTSWSLMKSNLMMSSDYKDLRTVYAKEIEEVKPYNDAVTGTDSAPKSMIYPFGEPGAHVDFESLPTINDPHVSDQEIFIPELVDDSEKTTPLDDHVLSRARDLDIDVEQIALNYPTLQQRLIDLAIETHGSNAIELTENDRTLLGLALIMGHQDAVDKILENASDKNTADNKRLENMRRARHARARRFAF